MNWLRLYSHAKKQKFRRSREQLDRSGGFWGNDGKHRFAVRFCTALVALLAAAILSRTDFRSPAAVRYAQWDRAYAAHDAREMQGILAPEFHLDTLEGERRTRSEYVEDVLNAYSRHEYVTRVRNVERRGPAVNVSVYVSSHSRKGKPLLYRYLDRWIERDGSWLLAERSYSWNAPHTIR